MTDPEQGSRVVSVERSVITETNNCRPASTAGQDTCLNDPSIADCGTAAPGGPARALPSLPSCPPGRQRHDTRTVVVDVAHSQRASMSERCDDQLASLHRIAYRHLGDHAAAAIAVVAAIAAAARLPARFDSAPVPVWHLLATHFQTDLDRSSGPRSPPVAVRYHQAPSPQDTAHSLKPRPDLAAPARNAAPSDWLAAPYRWNQGTNVNAMIPTRPDASTNRDNAPVFTPATPTEVTREMFRDLALVEDRKRIADDLHDTVVQRLFTAGLALQSALRDLPPSPAAQRIETAIAVMDDTIRQIRSTILALDVPDHAMTAGRAEILAVTAEATTTLGFAPQLRLEGPIDAAVTHELAAHLLAVLREALSNVARHASASRAEISVAVADRHLRVEVCDDGIGPGAGSRRGGRGITNFAHRAACLGGTTSLLPGPDGRGTVLTWQVPLNVAPPSLTDLRP